MEAKAQSSNDTYTSDDEPLMVDNQTQIEVEAERLQVLIHQRRNQWLK